MRRFEFVEGKSAKFWQAESSGTTFIVEFGRLGTKGQRKEKDFPNEDAAKKELEKKIAEKLREGYSEVATIGADPGAVDGTKGAQVAPAKLDLPTRFAALKEKPTEQAISKATAALAKLAASLGQRSFVVTQAHRRARNALAALGGLNPTDHPGLANELDRVLGLATRSDGTRLSLGRSLELLYELPTQMFERAMAQWTDAKNPPPGIEWLTGEIEALGDAELAFRLGALLLDRPGRSMSSAAGWYFGDPRNQRRRNFGDGRSFRPQIDIEFQRFPCAIRGNLSALTHRRRTRPHSPNRQGVKQYRCEKKEGISIPQVRCKSSFGNI